MTNTPMIPDQVLRTFLHHTQQKFASADETQSFYVADLKELERIAQRWKRLLPGVKPHYALKCNPDHKLVERLAALETNFDCASFSEMQQLLDQGIPADRFLFTNPIKSPSAIRFARDIGADLLVLDNIDELRKMKKWHPRGKAVLRIAAADPTSIIPLDSKFGCDKNEARDLLSQAVEMDVACAGICFHVGTGSRDATAYSRAFREAAALLKFAIDLGHPAYLLDIGGGFTEENLVDVAFLIRSEMESLLADYPFVQVIAEPGRLFARSVFSLAVQVVGRRKSGQKPGRLYLNDGAYGNFLGTLLERESHKPVAVVRNQMIRDCGDCRRFCYSLWGPTCDAFDLIASEVAFGYEIELGDWLIFQNMGAYTSACRTRFNGFWNDAHTYYIDSSD